MVHWPSSILGQILMGRRIGGLVERQNIDYNFYRLSLDTAHGMSVIWGEHESVMCAYVSGLGSKANHNEVS